MGIKPDVGRDPAYAAGHTLDDTTPAPEPKRRKLDESAIIALIIVVIFLFVAGVSYMFLGHSSGSASADTSALSGSGRQAGTSLANDGSSSRAGSAVEGMRAGGAVGEQTGIVTDGKKSNFYVPDAGQRVGDVMGVMGSVQGQNGTISTGSGYAGGYGFNESFGVPGGAVGSNSQYNLTRPGGGRGANAGASGGGPRLNPGMHGE